MSERETCRSCGDCLACELRDFRARVSARRANRHNIDRKQGRRDAVRVRSAHRRALADGATPEQLARVRAA